MPFTDEYESCGEILVCADCLHSDANGEHDPDRSADLPAVWSAIPFGYLALMGGEHRDGCDPETRSETGCECDDRGFIQSSCEGCGDGHHGDRFAYTLFRATAPYARSRHANMLRLARLPDLISGEAHARLADAAKWRGYLAKLAREARQHAA